MARKRPDDEEQRIKGRPVGESRTEMVQLTLPEDANVLGDVLGGRVMHLVDLAAAVAAARHCRSNVVTVSVDHLDFRNPVHVGELVVLKASVNRAFHTSMEVGVKVFSEDVLSGQRKHTTSAYLTFVSLDEAHNPQSVPPLICENADDKRRFEQALARRKFRLKHMAKDL